MKLKHFSEHLHSLPNKRINNLTGYPVATSKKQMVVENKLQTLSKQCEWEKQANRNRQNRRWLEKSEIHQFHGNPFVFRVIKYGPSVLLNFETLKRAFSIKSFRSAIIIRSRALLNLIAGNRNKQLSVGCLSLTRKSRIFNLYLNWAYPRMSTLNMNSGEMSCLFAFHLHYWLQCLELLAFTLIVQSITSDL